MTALDALFRDEVGRQVAVLRDGLRAAAGGAAADPGLRFAAHAIAGAARVVGQSAAERLAQALERALEQAPTRTGTGSPDEPAPGAANAALDLIEVLAQAGAAGADAAASARQVDALIAALTPVPAGTKAAEAQVSPVLWGLFRQECELHAATLVDGLLRLERAPAELEPVDGLMRAAHSIKGAARVVGLDAAVALAHAAEDLLIRVQRGEAAIGPTRVQALLDASDLLQRVAVGSAPGADTAAPPDAELRSAARRLEQAGAEADHDAAFAADDDAAAKAPLADDGAPAAAPRPQPAPGRPDPAVDDGDRVLRVRASHLSRMVALAGESLVETRRLKPFADAQHRLRTRQSGIADLLDELHRALGAPPADDAIGARITELRARLAEARGAVSTWVGEFEEYARRTEDLTLRLFREATESRMRPLADGLAPFPRLVRDLARRLGKQADLVIRGGELRIDRDILERIEAPLNHLLRNALDHGLETPEVRRAAGKPARGTLRLEARSRSGAIEILVADDGAGIALDRVRARVVERGLASLEAAAALDDDRLLDHLFVPGFSTADAVTEISGRGVGLDVVQSALREVGGSVQVSTGAGVGTRFLLRLPTSRAVLRSLVVVIAGEPHALPLSRIDRLLRVPPSEIRHAQDRPYTVVEGRNVAIVAAAEILELDGAAPAGETLAVVVVADRAQRVGFVVDDFLGEQDLVVRPMDPRLGRVADLSAAAILPDGAPVLILDIEDLLRSVQLRLQRQRLAGPASPADGAPPPTRRRVLVVDDSITIRELEKDLLSARGYEVVTAVDGMAGWEAVRASAFDLVITDVDMPRMDGIALTRSIKQDPRLSDLPVIIVSYRDTPEDRRRGLAAAADLYVSKAEYDDAALLQAVIDLIGTSPT